MKSKAKSQPPNVVVFFTDQQRWDTTGIHGNPLELTPNFDRMAQRGTHVYNSFTCQAVCGPARAALQTGMYATQVGCYRNSIPLPLESRTLGHLFREADYKTAYIGKWHLADEEPVPKNKRMGYDYWLASNLLEFTSNAYSTVVYDNDNKAVKLPGYRVDALTDAAIRYIDRHQRDPFFLFISYLEPHHQNSLDDYPPPDGYRERYMGRWIPPDLAALGGSTHQHIAGYFGIVKRLDEAFARILDALRSLELTENTVVLFTSDHGNQFKTRNEEYKRCCHESCIRVPMAFQGPEFDGGGRIEKLVSTVDIAPTLLDACGIPVPENMQGRSIMPLVRRDRQQSETWPSEVLIQISESQVGRAVRTRRWKYGVDAPDKDGWNDPDSEHYVEQFLYDLESDPYELTNLAGMESHLEVSSVMRRLLMERMKQVGEKQPDIEPAKVRASNERMVSREEALQ